MVNINEMQLGFVPGRGTTGAIVVVRQLEWAVRVIQFMYSNAQSRMQVNSQYNYEIGVGVSVHQDSALSPLLFIPVMEALSHEFSIGVPWELLLTGDLLFITNTQEECISMWWVHKKCSGITKQAHYAKLSRVMRAPWVNRFLNNEIYCYPLSKKRSGPPVAIPSDRLAGGDPNLRPAAT